MSSTDSEISAAYAAQGRTHLATADPRHRSPVHPDVTVVNAPDDDLLAELAYRNVATAKQAARAQLRKSAESYASDARKFSDMPRLLAADDPLSEEDCKRYAAMYRTIANELRKVAAEL
jgi:hypothetical protein